MSNVTKDERPIYPRCGCKATRIKPIIAYSTSHKGVVHNRCLHPMQKAFKDEMKNKGIPESRQDFPGVQSAWHPGHPSLPMTCAHCGKTIGRGTEVT